MAVVFIIMMCALSGFMGYEFGLEKCQDKQQLHTIEKKIDELKENDAKVN